MDLSTRKQALRELRHLVIKGAPVPELAASIKDMECREETRAGLYLLQGAWAKAHGTVQSVPGPLAAHWHGIVHRLEPDYANAKYWFQQVPSSPIYETLATEARRMGRDGLVCSSDGWDAIRFIDCCADPAQASWCAKLHQLEMEALLDYCIEMET